MASRKTKEELVSPESAEVQEFIKSQAWQEFCLEVQQDPLFLYRYLVGLNVRGLGYLFFLEDILGQQEFRCLCPLVLIPDKVFAADFLSFPRWRLSAPKRPKSRNLTFGLLSEYYFKSQQRKASQYWPKAIARYISNVIELVIRANFTKSLWEVYRTYLSVRYGLDNSFIPPEKPSRLSRKLRAWEEGIVRAVWEKIGAPKGMVYDIPNWEDNIRDAFARKDVRSWLEGFASSFQKGNYRTWRTIARRAKKRLGEILDIDSCLDVNSLLEVNLNELFLIRIANTFSSNGVDTLADLIVLSRGTIAKFEWIGEGTLYVVEKILSRFKLRLGMTEQDIKEWKKKNKKIKFRAQEKEKVDIE